MLNNSNFKVLQNLIYQIDRFFLNNLNNVVKFDVLHYKLYIFNFYMTYLKYIGHIKCSYVLYLLLYLQFYLKIKERILLLNLILKRIKSIIKNIFKFIVFIVMLPLKEVLKLIFMVKLH